MPARGPKRAAGALAASLAACLAALPALAQDAYRLAPMDLIRVRVSEWQTAAGTFRDWSAVSGDYAVGAGGNIAVPFVGEVKASGRTTAELGAMIGDSLQQRFGLADRPDAAVEIGTYRPVYVAGDVQTPGAHPFAPELSVLKAVSLAGGQRRVLDAGMRVERDILRARGDLDVLVAESDRLTMRRARVQAELNGAETFAVPPALRDAPRAAALLADEQAVMKANRERIDLQNRSLNDLKVLLASEVESLAAKRKTVERQIALTQEDLANVDSLANRGLVVATRVSDLQRRLAEYESQTLDIDTATLRARQDINRANQDLIRLENDRRAELAEEKRATDAELEANAPKREAERGLLTEALLFAPTVGDLNSGSRYSYTIMRTVNGAATEFAATEATPLQPGDVVKVTYSLPAGAF